MAENSVSPARQYVVLWEYVQGNDDDGRSTSYIPCDIGVEASSAEQACRRIAENLAPAPKAELEDSDNGVTLIAVPARSWTGGRHTLKAETTRRIRSTT